MQGSVHLPTFLLHPRSFCRQKSNPIFLTYIQMFIACFPVLLQGPPRFLVPGKTHPRAAPLLSRQQKHWAKETSHQRYGQLQDLLDYKDIGHPQLLSDPVLLPGVQALPSAEHQFRLPAHTAIDSFPSLVLSREFQGGNKASGSILRIQASLETWYDLLVLIKI